MNLGQPQAPPHPNPERERCPRCQGSDHFSPSRIEQFLECPRKWAWSKLDHIPDAPNRFAQFGLELHKQVENYLKLGKPLDLTSQAGEAAMAGVHLLPPPGYPGMQIEPHFDLYAWGHKFVGHKDIQLVPQAPLVIHGTTFAPGLPIIWDHKTTGDFKWAKTANPNDIRQPKQGTQPEDFYLGRNVQNVLYAVQAMHETKAPMANTRWVYYLRNKPHHAIPVDITHTRESVLPTLQKIKDAADQMAAWKASGAKALDLPYNPEMCDKFGGCPFRSNCNLSPLEKLNSFMSVAERLDPMSVPVDTKAAFLANIANLQAQQAGAGQQMNPPPLPGQPPPPPPAQGPTQPQIPAGATVLGDQYWVEGMANWAPLSSLPQVSTTPPPMPPMQNPGPPSPPPQQPPPMPPQLAPQAPPPTVPEPAATMPWRRPEAVVQGQNYWLPGMTDWAPIPNGFPGGQNPPGLNSPPAGPPPAPEPPKRGPGRPKGSGTAEGDMPTDAKVLASLVRLIKAHWDD